MILCWMFYMKNLELWDNRECREERKHMEYCLFRHGQTNWNVNCIIKSHMDDSGTHFTEAGQEQIKYITELLKNTGIQAVFASDLYRTTETANYINAYLKVPVFFSERLRGMDMGAFLGKPIEEFLQHEEVRKAFVDYDSPIPGGESINQLVERLCGALKGIRDNYSYTRVLVITHGGTGAIMESLQAGKPVIAVARLSKYGEHVDDHQMEIVDQFTKDNYVIGLHETNDLEQAVQKGLRFTPAKWNHGKSGLLPAIDHAIEDSLICVRCKKS